MRAAVATAMPSERVAAVRNLRRGRRVKLSAMRRRNMAIRDQRPFAARRMGRPKRNRCRSLSFGHFGPGFGDGTDVYNDVAPCHAKWDAYGITAAGFADGRNINRGTAVAANYVLPVLAVAFCSANGTAVECDAPPLRLLDDQKTERLVAGLHREKMKVAILHVAEWNAQFVVPCSRDGYSARGWRSRVRSYVNKIRGQHKN